jgi:thiamine-monophosphate kinase
MLLVKDIGEQGLLQILHQFCPSEIIGDDAAVISTSPEQKLVVTTDVLVENVHFSDRTTPPDAVGWRAAAANLSDLAAMGADPLGITVGLSLRGDLTVNWVEQLYQGMKQCLDQYHTPILGGDLCRSSLVTIAITALGQVNSAQVISRSGAKPGDAIVTTGLHGLSKAGLELLLDPKLGENLNQKSRKKLILAHQRPQPRLDVIKTIQEINPQRRIAGMDSSDGLADAIIQICRCSGVGAEVKQNSIVLSSDILKLVSPEKALEWTLFGGEDFELVLCLPVNFAQMLINKLKSKAAIIGKITEEKNVILVGEKTVSSKVLLSQKQSFQHF